MEKKADNSLNSQERIKKILQELKNHNITKQDLLLNFLQQETQSQIFDNQTIQTLENVTKQLKEIKKIKPKQALPNYIPMALFSDRTLSMLEHVTTYLKDQHELSYKEIATLLNRDHRTIWTTYQRAKKKRGL